MNLQDQAQEFRYCFEVCNSCESREMQRTLIQEEFKGIKVKHIERNSLVPERGSLNVNKARDLINYKPIYNLDLGYRKYINWYKDMFTDEIKNNSKINAFSQINE